MANPVLDDITQWQPDASFTDTNLPIKDTSIGIGTGGDLTGELRRIKSEIRGESIIKSWERWLGLNSLTTGNPIVFSYGSSTHFGVTDNFLASNRFVAKIGRRVRAHLSGGTIYGTIVSATFSVPSTVIGVFWDAGALDGTLSEVQFGLEHAAQFNPVLRVDSQAGVISNTNVEFALITTVIPQNYLGTQNQIELKILSRFGLIAGGTAQILALYGGQQAAGIAIGNLGTGTIGITLCPITVTVTAGGTGAQTVAVEARTPTPANNIQDLFAGLCQDLAQIGATAQDSTQDQPLDVHVIFNTANPANQVDYLSARLQLFAV